MTEKKLKRCAEYGLNNLLAAVYEATDNESDQDKLLSAATKVRGLILEKYGIQEKGSFWFVSLNDEGRRLRKFSSDLYLNSKSVHVKSPSFNHLRSVKTHKASEI